MAVYVPEASQFQRWLRAIADTAAPVLIAVAVGSGILGWWQTKELRRTAQPIMLNLVKRSSSEVSALADAVLRLAYHEPLAVGGKSGIPASNDSVFWASQLFTLPVSESQVAALKYEKEVLHTVQVERVASGMEQGPDSDLLKTPESLRFAQNLHAAAVALRGHAEAVWESSVELVSYLDNTQGVAVREAADGLRASVHNLLNPMDGQDLTEHPLAQQLFAMAGGYSGVLDSCAAVAHALTGVFRDLQRSTNEAVSNSIAQHLARRADLDEELREQLKSDKAFRELLSTLDK